MKGQPNHYSAKELSWIKAMATKPRREVHALFVQVWNRPDVTYSALNGLCKRMGWMTGRTGRYVAGECRPDNPSRKGHHAAGSEKGWFAKGHRGGRAKDNYQPIGTERLTKEGYVQRKINDDMPLHHRWQMVHRLNWEAANGPMPEGHALKCLDGNRRNTDAANWVAVPRSMLPRLNSRWRIPYDQAAPELRPAIMAVASLEQAAADVRKGPPA